MPFALFGHNADGCTVWTATIKYRVIVKISIEVGIIVPTRFFVRIVEYGRGRVHKCSATSFCRLSRRMG